MTGPEPGDPTEGATAETGTTRTGSDFRAIAILIAVGIALRLIIAYVLLAPGSGFGVDVSAFRYWADNLAQQGPFGFYTRGFFADYTPGYLYVLWLVGIAGSFVGGAGDLIKLPAILADGALAFVVWWMVRDLGGGRRAALLGAGLVLFNPVTWFDSAIWGQVDSVGTVVLLLAVRELWKGRMVPATVLTTIAAIIKPQFGILIPIAAVVILHRYLATRPTREGPPGRVWRVLASLGVRRPVREGPIDVVGVLVAGIGTAFALSLPFALMPWDLAMKIATTAAQYSYLTVNAYNPWALVSLDGSGLASSGTWVLDVARDPGQPFLALGPVPAVAVGTALLLALIAVLCAIVWRRDDRRTLLVVLMVIALGFFILPTRVHERYLYPAFALGAILAATSFRWRLAYLVLAVATFLNLYAIITLPFYDNPGIADWLRMGDLVRSPAGVAAVALAHVGVFLWALTRLRRRAVEQDAAEAEAELLAEEATDAVRSAPSVAGVRRHVAPAAAATAAIAPSSRVATATAPAAAAAAMAMPGVPYVATSPDRADDEEWYSDAGEPYPDDEVEEEEPRGATGWFRRLARFGTRDRTALLVRERGGRLDRLDLWILLVLVVAALVLRTYRLAEPYRMHFDEVYHARTATEFLQFWRYGEPHDIYEYTHPHLAKYAMAAGIVAFGNDRVASTSDLGVPVVDATVEPRWEDPTASSARRGDRLYVATGQAVLAYDLASRALVATIAAPGARAVAVDASGHRLLVGTEAGQILALDTSTTLDALRAAGKTGETLPVPDTLSSVGAAVSRLYATTDGSTIAAGLAGDILATVDATSGAALGRTVIPGLGGMADGGTASAIVVDTSAVTDPKALAAELARIAGLDEKTVQARIAAGGGLPVVVSGGLDPAVKTAVDDAIAAGTLPGVTDEPRARLAVAAAAGLDFVDPTDAKVTDTVALPDGPAAADVAEVGGVGNPAVYVVGGRTLWRVDLGADSSGAAPTVTKTLAMPGEVRRVLFDGATQQVHALGIAPDGSGDTIYVVEPNGVAVYADAHLPFRATAWAMDSDWERPATDRQQILSFAADGASAAVSVGAHAFAWRLPGVIVGALTIGALYLLLRLLFRRRAVAAIAGILALADGMMFVQSRIAMNDVYVGFFIITAFLVFAALWTGRLRGWVAFAVGMPIVGLLLGLGLASKWVALYALGGIGILILARSALGRIVLVLGLAGVTASLGYMAIVTSPTATTSSGKLFFLGLMIGLTLLAVVVTVLRPVAWSLDEMRFAVYVPGALGILGALVGFAIGVGTIPPDGPPSTGLIVLAVSGALVALSILALAAFRVGARFGMGPLAPAPGPDDPARLLPPPDPAPEGWLRLGSGRGLPAVWLAVSILLIPVAVYVVSYLPWVALGNRLTEAFPAGNTGQTLLDLTKSMYDYHNNLRATHAASSPWWAWPFDLKPVWFYQSTFGDTSAAIYDSGNLGIWWIGVPAIAFIAWQAFRRHSLALALIGVGFFVMWLPWVRIDRATFQYHYYTALIFLLAAVAYLIAEVWHGPSRRTWLLVRVAAAIAVMGPALLWLFRMPLCFVVGVDKAYPNSPACAPSVGQLVVTERVAAIVAILVASGILIAWQMFGLERAARDARADHASAAAARVRRDRHLVAVAVIAAIAAAGLILTGLLSDTATILDVDGIRPEIVALLALVPLGICAYVIVTARDPRRFAVGFIWAVALLFVFFYPNISALPLPSQLFNAYQGILPTWLYVFQFPVNTDPPVTVKLLDVWPAILFVALLATCAVVAYSTWSWRVALAERAAGPGDVDGVEGDDDAGTDAAAPA